MSACFRSITAALIAVAIFTPGPVLAQDDMADRLLVCDGIDDPAERMACFNEVVDG